MNYNNQNQKGNQKTKVPLRVDSALKTLLPKSHALGLFASETGHQTYTVFRPEFGIFDNTSTKGYTALFLSRLLYWTGKGTISKEYVVKTNSAWQAEICCSPYQLKAITNNLVKQRILEKEAGRGNVQMYKADWGRIDAILIELEEGNKIIEVKAPRTNLQKACVSFYLKGSTKYEAYCLAYDTSSKSTSQINAKARIFFSKFADFIEQAKNEPSNHFEILNGTYKNTPVSIQIKIDEKPKKAKAKVKTKKVREVKPPKNNKEKLNQNTNFYLDAFTEKHKELFERRYPNLSYEDPSFKKDGKERTRIRSLITFIQAKILATDTPYKKALDIPVELESEYLKAFLAKAITVNNGWFVGEDKGFVPSWIDSMRTRIYDISKNEEQLRRKSNPLNLSKLEADDSDVKELAKMMDF